MSVEAPRKRSYDDVAQNDQDEREQKRQKQDADSSLDSNPLLVLPAELRENIFSYLNWKDAVRLRAVSSVWYQETMNSLKVLHFKPDELNDARDISWILSKSKNISSLTQLYGSSYYQFHLALMALSQFQLNRLTSLHTQVSNFEDFKQMIEHMKSLEDLTWATKDTGYYTNADEIFSYFCVQFSQRHLTRLTLDTNVITSRGLESLSLLTGLKDFTLKNSRCGLPPLSTNLRRLNLYECHGIRGFDVSLFPYLESLTVQNPAWTVALAKITQCGNLTQLKPNIKFPMTALPIHKMTQLQDLEYIMHPEISTNEQFDNLTPLIHLTKLDLINPSPASNFSSLWSLTQLKALFIKSFIRAYFPIDDLCNALPNLESLTLDGWMAPQSAPNISSLRHLTALVIECPNCSAHLPGLQHLPCHKISGIDSLTNLEVLELKICGYPSLSQLTRLRSLTYRVNCHSQPVTAAQFIDHVANVPKLALEKFQITGVAEKSIHDSITRLITLQTSLQELLVGTAPSPEKSRSNYHTSTLMGFKKSMQQYADELKEKEKEAAEWSDDDKFSLSL